MKTPTQDELKEFCQLAGVHWHEPKEGHWLEPFVCENLGFN